MCVCVCVWVCVCVCEGCVYLCCVCVLVGAAFLDLHSCVCNPVTVDMCEANGSVTPRM